MYATYIHGHKYEHLHLSFCIYKCMAVIRVNGNTMPLCVCVYSICILYRFVKVLDRNT